MEHSREIICKPIFVVGASRSGTTLMGRIVGRHPDVFTFHELHFFEEMWSPQDHTRILDKRAAIRVGSLLFQIQRDGYLKSREPGKYSKEAGDIVAAVRRKQSGLIEIFERFLIYETERHGKKHPCDHTPRNVFYIAEILKIFPEARIVCMVRDPRDVLLSQKNKWRRRFLGGRSIPLVECLRSWVNYHPFVMSKLWNSAVQAGSRFITEERVATVYFERLLAEPQQEIQKICSFLGLHFNHGMLDVPQVGSSHTKDDYRKTGIDKKMANNWKRKDGLSSTELYWCERTNAELMKRHSYKLQGSSPDLLSFILSVIMIPMKTALALFMNVSRMRNLAEAVRRRVSP